MKTAFARGIFKFFCTVRSHRRSPRRDLLGKTSVLLAFFPPPRYTVREKYEPRLWRNLFGIFLLIFLAIRCIAASSRRGETNFAGDSAKPNTAPYAFAAPFSQNSFKKNFEKEIRCPPKVRSNQKRQDGRLRQGEARNACRVARARASTKYERTVSAFDRVRITPLQYKFT